MFKTGNNKIMQCDDDDDDDDNDDDENTINTQTLVDKKCF